jgi:hypothetical protein
MTTTTATPSSDNEVTSVVIEAQLIRYKAYSLSGDEYDSIREIHSRISLFELTAHRVPLNVRVKKWYQMHQNEPLLVTTSLDKLVTRPPEQKYYSDAVPNQRPSYNILVDRLHCQEYLT